MNCPSCGLAEVNRDEKIRMLSGATQRDAKTDEEE